MLKGKIAVVTGASSGIGAEISKLFVANGATVIGTYGKTEPKAEGVDFHKVDVSSFEESGAFFEAVSKKFGHADILVNCAGITNDATTRKMTEEQFDSVIDVNLKGTWNIVHFFGPDMQANKSGSIINISSVVGVYGNIGQSNYAASKAGVIGMTKTWAKEFSYKGSNVRCNAIAPGYIMTRMMSTVPEELLRKFEGMTMLGRLGNPEEIANVALFLASDMSSYVTGTVINADGGMRL